MRPRTQWIGNNGNGDGNGDGQKKKCSKATKTNKGGRPSLYNPDKHPALAYRIISRNGISNEELAAAFMISEFTLYHWINKYPEFSRAVREGWYSWNNSKVKKSLAQQAVGYYLDDEKIFCNANGEVTRVPYRRWYPPVTTATIFWLTNRCKDDWVHMNRIEHTGKDGQPIQTEDLAARTLIKELFAKTNVKSLVTLKESLESIICANAEPI